jgi:hypothetical protein
MVAPRPPTLERCAFLGKVQPEASKDAKAAAETESHKVTLDSIFRSLAGHLAVEPSQSD